MFEFQIRFVIGCFSTFQNSVDKLAQNIQISDNTAQNILNWD